MPFTATKFPGVQIFTPQVHGDHRGYFFEGYNRKTFQEGGIHANFVQDNQARSSYGVVRALHYQVAPYAQAKLVRVLQGEVLDVILDLREDQPTFGQWMSIHLSSENKKQMFVPRGFAHGYIVLSETAEFFYKCDNYYSKAHEGGVRYDDPSLNIDWEVPREKIIANGRDQSWPLFGAHRKD